MSRTPTWPMTQPKSSGRRLAHAHTSRPPFEPPMIASFAGCVYFSAMRNSAAAQKSSKQFSFLSSAPPLFHSLPYSPPPRMFAMASTAPKPFMNTMRNAEYDGWIEMLKPP
eukprot:Amastigsp_a843470_16.p5 type:complete len:111 gc:universal Amastigsp_a843470_16:1818-1486(-)